MSCENTDELRLITKYSSFPGEVPTIPISGDHNDGTWLPTDLYVGEMFINVADNLAWVRGMDGIFQIGATGGSFSFTGDYVYKSTGGTYSGDVYAPTFSSIGVVTQNIIADTISATYFVGGSFVGDGSGLTGINANWLGGSVSNPSSFNSNLSINGPVIIDGTITSTDNIVDICSDVNVGCGYGVSASYFIGDGSQLTNLPIGTYSNFYTISATLSGNEIQFNRNDLVGAYSIDLTPLLSTYSVSSLIFDGITNELTLTYDNGNYFSALIDSFQTLSVINDINANEVYANNFYGVFNGTFSNDIYTISATLSGTTAIFDRTDGITYSLDLSSLSTGASQTLAQTLALGNTTGNNWIEVSSSNYGVRNLTNPNDQLGFGSDRVLVTAASGSNSASISLKRNGTIELNATNGIDGCDFIISDAGTTYLDGTSQAGIQYFADYSATYTNRSLVDKEYVDNAIPSTPSLSDVMTVGNNTNNKNIIFNNNYGLENVTGEATIDLNEYQIDVKHQKTFGGNPANYKRGYLHGSGHNGVASIIGDEYNVSSDYYRAGSVDVTNTYSKIFFQDTTISTGNGYQTELTVYKDSILVNSAYNSTVANSNFSGLQYNHDYSANFTNRSLVDKEYVTNSTLPAPTSPTIGPNVAPTASTSNFDGYTILGKSLIDTKEFNFGSYMPKRSFKGITTNGTYVLATVPIPDAAVDFFEFKYTARNGAYGREVGTIVAFYDTTTDSVNFSRTGPVSIGDVSGFDLDVVRNGVTLELTTTITNWTWSFCVHTMIYLSGITE